MRKVIFQIGIVLAAWAVTTSHASGQNNAQKNSAQNSNAQKSDGQSAQQARQSNRSDDDRSSDSRSSSSGQARDNRGQSAAGQFQNPDVRLHYDEGKNRLSIDVDDAVRFKDPESSDESWTRNGQLDLRYNRDRNLLRGDIEGTLRLNQIGSDMADWWQSWWEEEKQSRRSRQASAEQGAQEFVRQYDQDDDGYLTRKELPQRHRADFAQVDRNDDGYLSRSEIRQYGDMFFGNSNRSNRSTAQNQNQNQNDDETWSQWWASWFGYDTSSRSADESSATGARQFVRDHDNDGDGYVTRRELPARMRDEFQRIDRNDDGYLSTTEIRQHGSDLYRNSSNRSASNGQRQRSSDDDQTWSDWWSSWSSDQNDSDLAANQVVAAGAREFVQRYDQNEDGYLVRSELPSAMYDEFESIDQNDDRQLTRTEVQRYADRTRGSWSGIAAR